MPSPPGVDDCSSSAPEPGGAASRDLGRMAPNERITRQILLWARLSFVLVGSMPFWLPLARRYLPAEPVWLPLDWLFLPICHRIPARTLTIVGVAMPLCSRCAGIFAGLAVGALFSWPRLGLRAARWALGAAGLLMLLDVLAQELSWHPLWHTTRLGTGMLLGHLMACTLFAAIRRERSRAAPTP